MKSKGFRLFVCVILLMALVVTGCTKEEQVAQAPQENPVSVSTFDPYGEYKPKLWLVENGNNKIYLLGSVHVGVEDMYPLPDYILDAFNDSSVLAVESDIEELETDQKYLQDVLRLSLSANPIKNILAINKYNDLKSMLQRYDFDIETGFNGNFKPMFYYIHFANLMVEKTEFDSQYGVDRHLLVKAKEKNMEIKNIEDPLLVSEKLFTLPDEVQIFLLNDTVKKLKDGDEGEEDVKALYKTWVNGNIEEYVEQAEKKKMESGYSQKELDYIKEYDDAMENNRNITMTDKVIEYLQTDQVHFYVVGSLHYYGEHGILERLKNKGYTLKEISP